MDADHEREPIGGNGDLGGHDRRGLRTLELSARSGSLRRLWRWVLVRMVLVWGAQLAMLAGVAISVAALVTMWVELDSHVLVAVASEVLLTAGALLFAHGLRLWWYWRRIKRGLSG